MNKDPYREKIDIRLAQRIVDHWKIVIPSAKLESYPYDHFYLEQAFPVDVYEKILEYRITSEYFEAFNLKKWKRSDGTSTRDMMFLCDDSLDSLDSKRKRFWSTLSYAFYSDILRQLIFSTLKNDVSLRLNIDKNKLGEIPAYAGVWLIRDTDGYRIKPHPDGQPRVVTVMFYLPEDNNHPDLGTSVYIDQGKLKGLYGKRFKEVYRFPFLRNSMAVFAVNDLPNKRSIHGRERVKTKGERNTILLSYKSIKGKVKYSDYSIQDTHNGLRASSKANKQS